jgi:hypothetical protein
MERFDRQILLFGEEGQNKIAAARVAVIGLGGLGSHLAQQLAHLGVERFLLVDSDVVDTTNLNRLIGATAEDAGRRRQKVDVAARMINAIEPRAEVEPIPVSLVSRSVCERLKAIDFVFGCLDNDGPRLLLTIASAAFRKPYFDTATDIHPGETPIHYGGRVIYARGGSGCAHCLGVLDEVEVRRWMATDSELRADERLYGKRQAGESPSVVCLNGVVASAACMEFMVEVTGLRPANRSLEYDGTAGKMRVDITQPSQWCPYCDSFNSGSVEYLDRILAEVPEGHR